MFVRITYLKNVIEYYQIRDSTQLQLILVDECLNTPITMFIVSSEFSGIFNIIENYSYIIDCSN
jgi:hypothetical protein